MQTLDQYYVASGLKLNLQKSCLFLDGNNYQFTQSLAQRFGLSQGSLPVRYLGLPLLPHKLRPQDYQILVDKVLKRISVWTVRHLSFAGRLQLIRSVIYSLINFWLSVFPLPKSCLAKLERICNGFLWNGSPVSAQGAKISWNSICTPKEAGGLGLRRLVEWNKVFGLKLIWLLFTRAGSLWVSWVHRKLIRNRVFWDSSLSTTGSWIWKRLLKLRELARPYLYVEIGSGASTYFWYDDWTSLGPLLELTGSNGPRVSGIPRTARVSQAVFQGAWVLPSGRNPIVMLLREAVMSQSLPSSEDLLDRFLWRHAPTDSPREFSSLLTWNSLQPSLPLVPWHKAVWFSNSIPKHAFMFWVVVRDRLPSRDRLRGWGLQVPSTCLLCGSLPESREHLFFECTYSQELWLSFVINLPLHPPAAFHDVVLWALDPSRIRKLSDICKLLLQATIYEIWRERNSRLHNRISTSVTVLSRQIRQIMRSKLAYLDSNSVRPLLNIPTQEESYLSNWFRYIQL